MACSCKKSGKKQFLWYSTENPEGIKPIVYDSEIEARARKIRKGGQYIPYNVNVPIGVQIATAEAARAAAGV